MNTSIRFPSDGEKVRREVIGLVEKMLGGQAAESEIQEATRAVCDAFHSADCMAGSGIGHTSNSWSGNFYAYADIDTGRFQLYKNVEAP
jgi:hypothetical protein